MTPPKIFKDKSTLLLVVLIGFFITNTLIAEFIGIKIFSLEKVFGAPPLNIELFGVNGLGFNLTAGVLLWPVVFLMTDVINEYFGTKIVRRLSYFTILLVCYAFGIVYGAIALPPNDWWANESGMIGPSINQVSNMDVAFNKVMGQGLWIIIGSMVAFLVGQILDVFTFHQIRKRTGEKMIWLRATGSTLVSQLIDSFVVLFIAFYIGNNWDLTMVLAIGTINYIYKFIIAICLTPVIYALHYIIDNWLGQELADTLKHSAQSN